MVTVLDHGYVNFVESWGSDERIIESARMSTNKGFQGWGNSEPCAHCDGKGGGPMAISVGYVECPMCNGKGWRGKKQGDEKLLRYLWEHKHWTPFEMAGLTIEVQAPIFVFREWHRHRTQCLAGDTVLNFDLPGGIKRRGRQAYSLTIAEVFRKFQPTVGKRKDKQGNPYFKRDRVRAMELRCVDESTGKPSHTKIVDCWQSGMKEVFEVTLEGGSQVTMSKDHRCLTKQGWRRLEECADLVAGTSEAEFAVVAPYAPPPSQDLPEINETTEEWVAAYGWEGLYEVSSEGRARRILFGPGVRNLGKPMKRTVLASGYVSSGFSRNGKTTPVLLHRLVLESFVGPCPEGHETCHVNGNRLDARLANLRWGTAKSNQADRIIHGSNKTLRTVYQRATSIVSKGIEMTYDIEVSGPSHNFSADGMIVHNSYNELSARYTEVPELWYVPSNERLQNGGQSKKNKQGSGEGLDASGIKHLSHRIDRSSRESFANYRALLDAGVARELARLVLPVNTYSRMRASANLRNWLGFLTLRMDESAQWEIREYANAVHAILAEKFPRTLALFDEGNK